MKICPICETENQPKASHCEVCGERLGAPAAGEELAPEENVLGLIGHAKVAEEPQTVETPPVQEPGALPPTEEAEVSEEELLRQFAELEQRSARSRPPEPGPPPTAPETAPVPEPPPEPPPEAQPRHRPVSAAPALVSQGVPTARLVIYRDKQPVHTHAIVNDETLIGRYDALSGAEPDLDMTDWDRDAKVSRKHAYIYRMNGDHFVSPVSNAGTQVGSVLVEMGTRHKLQDGDIVVLSMALAMKFHLDAPE